MLDGHVEVLCCDKASLAVSNSMLVETLQIRLRLTISDTLIPRSN